MKTYALVPVVVSSLVVDDSSALLSVTQTASTSNLLAAVGHRNVTAMQALVQELADESVNEPGWKYDTDIQDALTSIRNMFVKNIQASLVHEHKINQESLNCFTKNCFGNCVKEYEEGYKSCEAQSSTCETHRVDHETCRKSVYELYKTMGNACGELHCYKYTDFACDPKKCLAPPLGKCHTGECVAVPKDPMENKEEEEEDPWLGPIDGPWLKHYADFFNESANEWDGLLKTCEDAYHAFLLADAKCDAIQKQFETSLCTKNTCEDTACNTVFDQCMDNCWASFALRVNETDCQERDRKIDWSATKKIECYIDVLLHDYTEKELLNKCGKKDCINVAREEDYKHCSLICPNVDHDGCWPEVVHQQVMGHQKRTHADQHHLGDAKDEFACDENGPQVFTKHRGHHASGHTDGDNHDPLVNLDRDLELRCTEHLDIDYPMPKCRECEPPPEPVCDADFHKKWYNQFDSIDKIANTCLNDCCSDFTDINTGVCFGDQTLDSARYNASLDEITIKEHSEAWAFNRCPCSTQCDQTAGPDYGARPEGRQCGDGPHTLLPAAATCKDILEYKNLCISAENDQFASINFEDNLCIEKMTFKHTKGRLSCHTNGQGGSNWGCDNKNIGLVLADSNNAITAPAFYTAEGMTPLFEGWDHAAWYMMDGVQKDSKQMEWIFKQPYSFAQGDYKLWYSEDLSGATESDNSGRACFDLALTHSKSCHALAPLQFENVCVSAAGDKPHTIKLPEDTRVTKIDIHWISGHLSCRTASTGQSNFGCDENSLGLVWTKKGNSTVIMPLQDQVADMTMKKVWAHNAHWYTMADVHRDSRTLPMKLEKPLPMGGSFDLWYNEDLTGGTEHDNDGTACYTVTVHRAQAASKKHDRFRRAIDEQ